MKDRMVCQWIGEKSAAELSESDRIKALLFSEILAEENVLSCVGRREMCSGICVSMRVLCLGFEVVGVVMVREWCGFFLLLGWSWVGCVGFEASVVLVLLGACA